MVTKIEEAMDSVYNRVSFIIVNYHTDDEVKRLVDEIHTYGRIVITDNSKTLDPIEYAKVICPDKNLGFAGGVNCALTAIQTDFICVLNPDIADGKWEDFHLLVEYMERHSNVGLIGPMLTNVDGSWQPSARTFYSWWLPFVIRGFPNAGLVRRHLLLDRDPLEIREVDWITGAFMLVRRSAWQAVGGMDPGFFLYLEDTDWCRRMWKAGWAVEYVPVMSFTHGHKRSSRGWELEALKFKWYHGTSFMRYMFKSIRIRRTMPDRTPAVILDQKD